MNKKTIIMVISSVGVLLIGVIATINYNSGLNLKGIFVEKEKKIEVSEWVSIKSAKETKAIKVIWYQKYGITRTEYCKVVFENKKSKKYKLVAPWIDLIIEQVNENDISFEDVPMDSAPKQK